MNPPNFLRGLDRERPALKGLIGPCLATVLLTACMLLLAACDTGVGAGERDVEDSLTFADVLTDSVFVEEVNDRTVTFRYYGTTPTPCYELYRVRSSGDGDRVSVTVVAAADVNITCTQALGRVALANLQVTAPVRGTVTFEFSRGDGPPLTRRVEIPVGSAPPPGAS